jgi:hypothetical protein
MGSGFGAGKNPAGESAVGVSWGAGRASAGFSNVRFRVMLAITAANTKNIAKNASDFGDLNKALRDIWAPST